MSDFKPMTPAEARGDLEWLDDFEVGDVYKTCRRALQTIANSEMGRPIYANGDSEQPAKRKEWSLKNLF